MKFRNKIYPAFLFPFSIFIYADTSIKITEATIDSIIPSELSQRANFKLKKCLKGSIFLKKDILLSKKGLIKRYMVLIQS